jgi:hypothetical protein
MSLSVVACPPVIMQFLNNLGLPNVNGTLLTQVGGVNYPTYQDSAGAIALPNPIPLNSRGEISNAAGQSQQLFLQSGVIYTFTLYDANGNQLWQGQYVGAGSGIPSYDGSGLTGSNNVVLPGSGDYVILVSTASGTVTFTGFVAQRDGQKIILVVQGANAMDVLANNAGSSSANQVCAPGDLAVQNNDCLALQYSQGFGKWLPM